jgi:hypothetical protein
MEDDFDDLKNTAKGLKGELDEESLKIKTALDMEADEIAKTIDNEVSGVKKGIDEGAADLSAMLEKESLEFDKTTKEIKDPLAQEAQEVSKSLNEGADKLNKSLNADNAAPAKKARGAAAHKPENKKVFDVSENKINLFEGNPVQDNVSAASVAETAPADNKPDAGETGQ